MSEAVKGGGSSYETCIRDLDQLKFMKQLLWKKQREERCSNPDGKRLRYGPEQLTAWCEGRTEEVNVSDVLLMCTSDDKVLSRPTPRLLT